MNEWVACSVKASTNPPTGLKLDFIGCKPITWKHLGQCGFESYLQRMPSIVTGVLGIVTVHYRVLIYRISEGLGKGKADLLQGQTLIQKATGSDPAAHSSPGVPPSTL